MPLLGATSVWSEVSALYPREPLFSARLTDTLHNRTPLVPTPALDPPDALAVRKLISSLPTDKCPGPSGLRNDHVTHLPAATYNRTSIPSAVYPADPGRVCSSPGSMLTPQQLQTAGLSETR